MTSKIAAHCDNDDFLELAESYVDLFTPRRSASLLTDSDAVEFCAQFRDSCVCKQFGIHDNETGTKIHRYEY